MAKLLSQSFTLAGWTLHRTTTRATTGMAGMVGADSWGVAYHVRGHSVASIANVVTVISYAAYV
jgi:hypothetical protein